MGGLETLTLEVVGSQIRVPCAFLECLLCHVHSRANRWPVVIYIIKEEATVIVFSNPVTGPGACLSACF